MPMFDYACPHCGTQKEVILKASRPSQQCECGGLMTLQVSKANFELKGSGWYKDGYK